MKTNNFNFKKNDPLIANNLFGKIGGYYKETVSDKSGIWIRFTRSINSNNVYIRSINDISSATKEEVENINK